jgi:transcriptional regulator with XRE-family HTH domain
VADIPLSSRLRQARRRKRMTQLDLAKALEVSQSAVAQWESGRSFPSEDVVPRLRKLLEIDISPEEGRRKPGSREFLAGLQQRPLLPIIGRPVREDPELVLLDGRDYGQTPAPPQLEAVPNATTVYARGHAMEPRYFPGELVYLHPDKAPNPGDFVFVTFKAPGFAAPVGYIRQFLGADSTHIRLRTLNPRDDQLLPREGLIGLETIVGSGLF